MVALLLGVLEQGLKLWNSKEATKYLDRVIELKKEYHEELSHDFEHTDQLKLDSIMHELKLIAEVFVEYSREKK